MTIEDTARPTTGADKTINSVGAAARAQIGARLDRLPITSLHRRIMVILTIAYAFEFCDLYTFSYAAPTLMREWGISVDTVAFITSASFVGMFFGAAGGGWVADHIGRRRAIIYSTLLYTVGSLLNAVAWDATSIAAFRMVTGLGLSAMTVSANTYIGEFFPASYRGRCLSIIATISLIAVAATAWVARFVVTLAPWSWRLLFVWGSLGLIILFFTRQLFESPRWQQSRGKLAEAEATTAELEKCALAEGNKLPEPEDIPYQPVAQSAPSPYRELISKRQRGRTILMCITWAFQSAGFYGFMAWLPTFLFQRGFPIVHSLTYTAVISLCGPIGAALSHTIIDRVDRKWFVTVNAVSVAALGLLFGNTDSPTAIMILGGLLVIALQMAVVALYTYTPEHFGTSARASGTGLAYGAGRLSNIASPFVIAAILNLGSYSGVYSYVAGCWVAVALLVGLFGSHTSRRSLDAIDATPSAK